jgi:hypothetical protein
MKKLSIFLLCALLFGIGDLYAFNTSSVTLTTEEQAEETKKEINVKKLPKEITLDITENHNGATILKAYETFVDGEKTGYLVEIKKVNREATLTYDIKGNPVNRVTPQKI